MNLKILSVAIIVFGIFIFLIPATGSAYYPDWFDSQLVPIMYVTVGLSLIVLGFKISSKR